MSEFKVRVAPDFFEESDWLSTDGDKKTFEQYWMEEYERVTSNDLLLVRRAGNGTMVCQGWYITFGSEHYQLFSDEAVESIGREDYYRTITCLGKCLANACFREKRSGFIDMMKAP
jgi:hypothetical protein